MTQGTHAPGRKALLFGLDGIGWHSLQDAHTPNLDRIAAAGGMYPVRVDDRRPTISAPNWATVLTGVEGDLHQVKDNLDPVHKLYETRNIFEQLSDAAPELKTFAAVTWPTLVVKTGSGPVLRGGGYVPNVDLPEIPAEWAKSDQMVHDYSLQKLEEGFDFAFIYFGQSDCTAHQLGTGDAYRESIEQCDFLMGPLLDYALDGTIVRDGWAVAAVTDHGHIDGGGHGGNSPQERASWIAEAGLESVRENPSEPGQLLHAEITPSLVKFLTGS